LKVDNLSTWSCLEIKYREILLHCHENSFTFCFVIFSNVLVSVIWTSGQISITDMVLIFSHVTYCIIVASIAFIYYLYCNKTLYLFLMNCYYYSDVNFIVLHSLILLSYLLYLLCQSCFAMFNFDLFYIQLSVERC
jgi:hypothetical protein